jgi:hypothetical protein
MADDTLTVDDFRQMYRKRMQDVTAGGRVIADEHTMTDAEFKAVSKADATEEK